MQVRLFTNNSSTEQSKKVYFQGDYPANHWSHTVGDPNANHFIAHLEIKTGSTGQDSIKVALYLNPTDSRGLRMIVALYDDPISMTFNREYTSNEKLAISQATLLLEECFRDLPVKAQSYDLGNNSHHLDKQTGNYHLGKESEPCMMHKHIVLRGNPELILFKSDTFPGIKLKGPKPGEMFNFRVGKEKWGSTTEDTSNTLNTISSIISSKLVEYQQSNVIFSNISFNNLKHKRLEMDQLKLK